MELVADQRIAAGVPATLRFYNVDGDGVAAAASGTVTVAVTAMDGTVVLAGGSSTTTPATGTYERALTAAQTSDLGMLTVTWSISGGGGTFTTYVEIVGRRYLKQAELVALQPSLADASVDDALLLGACLAAELEVEWICGRSFVRRARTVTLDGPGDIALVVPDHDLVTIDAASVDDAALTSGELSELYVRSDRAVEQPSGSLWAWGRGNVSLTYTYGLPSPAQDLKAAMAVRVRELYNSGQTAILARATQFTPDQGGGSYQLDRADRYKTGNPDIDAVYQRHSKRPSGDGVGGSGMPAGASRSIEMSPQFGSLFHGGRY